MNRRPKLLVILLRLALGWVFFYQGIQAFLNPNWTVAAFIQNPLSFQHFYAYVSQPALLVSVSLIVKILLVLVGALLILGIFVRTACVLGVALMLFFYFPLLAFPHVVGGYYIIDDHIIFALVLLYLYFARAGEYFGLGTMFRFSRY